MLSEHGERCTNLGSIAKGSAHFCHLAKRCGHFWRFISRLGSRFVFLAVQQRYRFLEFICGNLLYPPVS